jgi:ribosome-associated toxin RatA of RatAB toxin-antitoxin module
MDRCDELVWLKGVVPMISLAQDTEALLQGEILLTTHSYSAWGGSVTAKMYLPLTPKQVWHRVTDYPRWTQYFPDVTRSEVLQHTLPQGVRRVKRLYQVASKAFAVFSAQVEIQLKVLETQYQRVQFCLESGSFREFEADLQLEGCGDGTVLTYCVQAIPTIPVPSILIQQAIRFDLPSNMKQMRKVMMAADVDHG